MNAKRKKLYVNVYGTRPCHLAMTMLYAKTGNFLELRKDADGIEFVFRRLDVSDHNLLEMQFRNRLSCKMPCSFSAKSFKILTHNMDDQERSEAELTAEDLVRYFKHEPMLPRLQAEVNLHRQKLDWRNPELVAQEIKRLAKGVV